ncbi:regulator of nonsense transcripts 2, partial [Fusarium napiforme]
MDRARKRELRTLNEKAWDGESGMNHMPTPPLPRHLLLTTPVVDLFPVAKTLDSSLKKNTAFIKRLRTAITAATLSTFLQEIRTLSLHKYLSEIISACYEGLCRLKSPGEIEASVEIVSALHQRFGPSEFTEYLAWLLGKGMATPDKGILKALAPEVREKEEKERITRHRALLRVVTELWLVGVIRTLDDVSRPDDATKGAAGKTPELKTRTNKGTGAEPFPLEVLKDLLGHDREHANLPLLVIFVKSFSWDILGVKPTGADGRKTVEEDGTTEGNEAEDGNSGNEVSPDADQPFTEPEMRDRFRSILKKYFDDVKGHITRDQKSIQSQARRNAEAYVKSGEVFEDRQANYEKQVKAQERLVFNAQVIADVIGAEMPDLKDSDDSFAASNGSIGLVKTGDYLRSMGDGAGIWEDEDERRFYENLVDLKGKVPAILLEDGKKKKTDTDEQVGKKIDPSEASEAPKTAETADDQSTSIANRTIGAQVDALLARLPELTNKDIVDQTAIDFCFLNSKASRNRLVKALTEVPKGRSDLLPSWSRLVATLGRYMPDVPKGLVDYLDAEFRSLQRRKEKDFLGQVRLSNIRYLAELTKFGIVPEHVVFHCLKVSLDDFSRMNIEILCNLIENCGRYLLRNPETAPRMMSFLETLQRKKSVQHIGQPERMLIDNAVYYVDPPERLAIEQKERTPMELFVRKLIYVDMTKRNYSKILKQIRRLHWEETEVVAILEKVFSKPGKVKYGSVHLLGILLSALYRYHPAFVVKVIDNVIESMTFGLEQNDYRFYQRRIAEVKYLGELYNYRMLEHPVIFDTMYKIMTFGYGGPPVPGKYIPLDPPDDFFRIRLVSTMLETCGMFFNRGAAGKKLDYFLSFFQ